MLDDYFDKFIRTGQIETDVRSFLSSFGFPNTAEHCAAVAAEAKHLAERYQCNQHQAQKAGFLHDISVVIPDEVRLAFAESQQVNVLSQEAQFPMILHQKLSVVLAREIFQVTDNQVLSAIGCHTTLKAGASQLDKIVFIADKIAWDQAGEPPYLIQIKAAFDESLDAAVLVYLDHVWQRRHEIPVVHPWFVAAYEEMS